MKQKEVVERLVERGYTKKDARQVINDVIAVIGEAMASGEEVQFHGFGTFIAKQLEDRKTKDINTGEWITIPGHKVPRFVPSEALKRDVLQGVYRV